MRPTLTPQAIARGLAHFFTQMHRVNGPLVLYVDRAGELQSCSPAAEVLRDIEIRGWVIGTYCAKHLDDPKRVATIPSSAEIRADCEAWMRERMPA